MPSGKQAEITRLRKLVEARGYKVVPSGSGHWRVLDPEGKVVIDDDGPIIMSSTSSETRGRAMSVNRLMRAGILLEDPWKPDKPKSAAEAAKGEKSEQELAALEATAERSRLDDQRRSDRTRLLRERLEPVIVLLGGWEKRGVLRDLGLVAHYFANRQELRGRWNSADAASENADALRKGATLSPTMATIWEGLLDELEAWPDITLRYMQLLREAKGLATPTIGGHELVLAETAEDDALPAVAAPSRVSEFALEVAFEMGVGRSDSADRARIVQLAQRVAEYEAEVARWRAAAEAAERAEDGGSGVHPFEEEGSTA